MSDLTWMLKIVDGVSTPADHAARALKGVESALKAVDKASAKKLAGSADESLRTMQSFGKAMATTVENMGAKGPGAFGKMVQWIGDKFGQGAAEKVMGVAQGLSKADDALQSVGLSLGGVVGGGAMAAAAAIAAVGIAVVAVTAKLAQMAFNAAKAFASMVIERGRFREDTMAQLTAMLKSDAEAAKVFEAAAKFAKDTPFSSEAVISGFKNLLAGGFKADELEGWMRSIGDAAAVVGQDRIPDLVRALSKLRGTGKLTEEILEPLNLDRKKLAANAGLDDVAKLSGLDGKKAEEAIKKTIDQMYGGTLANMSKTLTGMLSNIGDVWNELIDNAFKSSKDGGGITAFFETVKGAAKDMLGALSGDTGAAAVSMINRLGDALNVVATVVRGFLGGLLGGFSDGVGKGADQVQRLSQADLEKMGRSAREAGEGLGKIAGAVSEIATRMPSMQALERHLTAVKIAAAALSPIIYVVGVTMVIAFFPLAVLLGAIGLAMAAVGLAVWGLYRAFKAVASAAWEIVGPELTEAWNELSTTATQAWSQIKDAFAPVLAALKPLMPYIQQLGAFVLSALALPFKVVGAIAVGFLVGLANQLIGLIRFVTVVVGFIGAIAKAAGGAWDAIVASLARIRGEIASISLLDEGIQIGKSLMDGLISGVSAAVPAVAGAASGAAAAMANAARSTAKVRSPSRVFAEIGGYMSEGLALGVTQKAPVATGAIADVVAPPSAGSVASQWSGAGQSAGPRGGSVTIGQLTVQSDGSPEDIRRSIVSAFEQINLQLNGAPA